MKREKSHLALVCFAFFLFWFMWNIPSFVQHVNVAFEVKRIETRDYELQSIKLLAFRRAVVATAFCQRCLASALFPLLLPYTLSSSSFIPRFTILRATLHPLYPRRLYPSRPPAFRSFSPSLSLPPLISPTFFRSLSIGTATSTDFRPAYEWSTNPHQGPANIYRVSLSLEPSPASATRAFPLKCIPMYLHPVNTMFHPYSRYLRVWDFPYQLLLVHPSKLIFNY